MDLGMYGCLILVPQTLSGRFTKLSTDLFQTSPRDSGRSEIDLPSQGQERPIQIPKRVDGTMDVSLPPSLSLSLALC